jgi:hypothetical protein
LSGSAVWYSAIMAGEAEAAQGVFHHLVVFGGTKNHADRRAFMSFANVTIQGLQIKLHFAEVLGLESADL